MIALLLATALAQEAPTIGRWVVHLDKDAEVVVFPQVDRWRIEVGIYHNEESLAGQVDGTRRWVEAVETASVGNGTTYLNFVLSGVVLSGGKVALNVVRTGEDVAFEFALQPYKETTQLPPLTSFDLAKGTWKRETAPEPSVALTALSGDASTARLNPSLVAVHPGGWSMPAGIEDERLRRPPTGWEAITGYRNALAVSTSDVSKTWARYRLGLAHEQLGMFREASYYYDDLENHGAPPAFIHLARAQADLRVRRWGAARSECKAAAHPGVSERSLLVCLGAVSLATGSPPPSQVGRALGAITKNPAELLLAGQLLQSDNRHAEALPLLAKARARATGDLVGHVLLSVGDAYWATGNTKGAYDAWSGVYGQQSDLAYSRRTMAEMVRDGRRRWAGYVPELESTAKSGGPPALEARWQLYQIHLAYGDVESAMLQLMQLRDQSEDTARRMNADGIIREHCAARIHRSHQAMRDVEVLAAAQFCWTPALDEQPGSVATLLILADSAMALGLHKEALEWQRRAVATQSTHDIDDPSALLRLATLYARTDHGEEALETLDYLGDVTRSERWTQPAAMARAEALSRLGRLDEAERILAPVARSEIGGRARRMRALLLRRLGRCEEAIVMLQSLPADDVANLAHARCELDVGNPEGARTMAQPLLDVPETAQEALWIIEAAAVAESDPTPPEPEDSGRWAAARREMILADELLERLRTQ